MSANVDGLFLFLGSRLQGRRCAGWHCPAETTEPQDEAGLHPRQLAHDARRDLPSFQLFCSCLLTCPRNPRSWMRRSAQPGPCCGAGPITWRPRALSSGTTPARRNQAPPWVEPQLGVQFQESEMSSSFCTFRPRFSPGPCRPSCRKQGGSWFLPPSSLALSFLLLPRGRSPARRPRPSATCCPRHPVLRETPGPPTLPASGDLLSHPPHSAGDLGLGCPPAAPLAHRDRTPPPAGPPPCSVLSHLLRDFGVARTAELAEPQLPREEGSA